MKRLAFGVVVLFGLAAILSAQGGVSRSRTADVPAPAGAGTATPAAAQTFQKYCVECHGTFKPEGNFSIERLLAAGAPGVHSEEWEKVADALESEIMPPVEATEFPSDSERVATAAWIRGALKAYADVHAGEPGRVTVRRLTSAEYAYAIQDLTGVDIRVGIDASSDSVGGEGFTNFGDVQFMQDANIERYLEAAKVVASHAVIGSGPLEFYTDPGATGLELSALARINELYSTRGFRVVSGEGGRPFGLERYGKALYVAWHYKHRVRLGDSRATLRDLAAKEGITGRFAEHVWSVVNRTDLGYPSREMVDRWKSLPVPTADVAASVAAARTATKALSDYLTTWPSWFFARGDLAAGGAGDESPLAFSDETLRVQPERRYTYMLGPRGMRGRGGAAPASTGPNKINLLFANLNPAPGVTPVMIWRNAKVITRAAAGPGRGAAAAGRGRGPAPVLTEQPLREVLPAEVAARLAFGTSPDGTVMGPDDFATTAPLAFEIDFPVTAGITAELQLDAALGADRNGVVRVMLSDTVTGSFRDVSTRVVFADTSSAGHKAFRAGMAEYAALLPPNSHGEANPADKDPVPAPFDNTYNSPEHDGFVLKVKYQRTDDFFTANMVDGADRVRLDHAWNDLFGSWPYHDAYLNMLADHYKVELNGRKITDMDATAIAALPAPMQPYVTPLRADYDRIGAAFAKAETVHINDVLAFASRAWRRPLTSDEQARLRTFYRNMRVGSRLGHSEALRLTIARVLTSPSFLYRLEAVAGAAEKPLSGYELASRLSFFLWSSVPDDELRRAAAAGELARPEQLARQVTRMTADPKARRIAAEFFGQWLGFYRFDEFRGVDTTRFPEFTDVVKRSMYNEALETFDYLVRQNRPLSEMFYADYTFLNKPLAAFYGITADVSSTDTVVKVDNAGAFKRGGLLRLGSVLTTTSAPLRTSPVKRGDWVLRRILGTPTPPPPADAGSLPSDPAAFGMTLRERLTQHKRNPTCANCHLRIDPLGFPLEGFDAIGRTREVYQDGTAVDDTGEFADKTTIDGADGLLAYLKTRDQQVMKTFSKKVLGYALGRTVSASDARLIDDMTASGGAASFTDFAIKVVTSRQFRHHQGDPAVASGVEGASTTGASAMNRSSR